jgi:class 3 adenylate cyclase
MTESKSKILVVDDDPTNVELFSSLLAENYEVVKAYDGKEALKKVEDESPDLLLIEVKLPYLNGYEVCERLKRDEEKRFLPVVMLALEDMTDKLKGIEAGADDFLIKPVDNLELLTRVKSLVRIKHLHDNLTTVNDNLTTVNANLKELNENLEQRVKEQVERLNKMENLKRYLSPKVADKLISEGISTSQVKRKNLTVFFSDIRGFTQATEQVEPEELIQVLNQYFSEMVQIAFNHGGTIGKFIGDGMMGFFGEPDDYPDHAQRAVRMALDMQEKVKFLNEESLLGRTFPIHIGIGIATGYVTVGNIGSPMHMDYTVIGRYVNLAARLESEAKRDQTLLSQMTYNLVRDMVEAEAMGEIEVKGFEKPVAVYNVHAISD